jgi:hypothetical protein
MTIPILPACQAQACNQGRSECPCPQACERPMEEDDEPWALYVVIAIVALIVAGTPIFWR